MKQTSTQSAKSFKSYCTILVMAFMLLVSNTASAHTVVYYTPPCFTQGSTVTVSVKVIFAGAGSYYHWQYRTAPNASWTWLSNGTNSINGRNFSVTNASVVSNTIDYTPNLVIANIGSPAYTTQLNNIELRVIMTNGLDPQTNAYPGTSAWGGEEFANSYEAKYLKLFAKATTDNCYSNCTGNMLVSNPAAAMPALTDYFGGFEMGSGITADNFSLPGTYGVTAKAATDISQWIAGSIGNAPRYRVINNPDSANSAFSAFAPHSGKQMILVSRMNNSSDRLWYRTIAVSNTTNFYSGQISFKVWFAKVDATNANMILEIKGATTLNGTVAAFANNSATQTISGNAGTWIQQTLTVNIPANTYKKLEISIHSADNTVSSVAIDDICLLEPQAATLPVVLSPLKAAYTDGAAHLTWATEQESNSSYFEIEHSIDGSTFSSTGKVYAGGTTSRTTNYKFDDVKAAAGINYYRLRIVDRDGRYEYSNTVSVNVNIKGFLISAVYPSPFTDKISLSIASENTTTAMLRLHDMAGRMISQQTVSIKKGINVITLDNLGKLNKGMYMVEVNCNQTVYTERIIK